MSRDDAGAGNVLLAFLVGAVAGAAVALLYAPATGRETRELIGEKTREGREKASALAEKGREKAAALAEKGLQVLNEGRSTLTTAIERGREAYEQARSQEKA